MHGLTNTGALLLAVFAVFLLALLAELSYVLWRLRRRRCTLGGSLPEAASPPLRSPVGKELMFYFLCCKNRSRIEPAGNAPPARCHRPEETAEGEEEEEEEDVAAKWQMGLLYGSYGPSRVLFTIKEEEREEGLSAEDNAVVSDDLRLQMPVDVGGGEDDEPTPFSTPCASPPYYTPSPSPGREGTITP